MITYYFLSKLLSVECICYVFVKFIACKLQFWHFSYNIVLCEINALLQVIMQDDWKNLPVDCIYLSENEYELLNIDIVELIILENLLCILFKNCLVHI